MHVSLTFNEIVEALGLLAALAGVWWKLQKQIDDNREEATRETNAVRLEMTKQYASLEELRQVERRLMDSINSLSKSIDRLIGRIDSLMAHEDHK